MFAHSVFLLPEGQVPISRGSAGSFPRRGVTPANVVGTWVDPHCASGPWCRIVVLVSCCGSSFQCRAGRRSARCWFLGKVLGVWELRGVFVIFVQVLARGGHLPATGSRWILGEE